jgi:nucleoside-diphosphate-sugar epimerase
VRTYRLYAYGVRDGVDYTLFRPFNWIGPKLDDVPTEGCSRLFTRFISNVMFRKPLELIDGGRQSRSFTFIDDGVQALMRIIENKDSRASRQIFNLGNPKNNVSVRDLAKMIIAAFQDYPDFAARARCAKVVVVSSEKYFERCYRDIGRVPVIQHARKQLGWTPKVALPDAIRLVLDYHIAHWKC